MYRVKINISTSLFSDPKVWKRRCTSTDSMATYSQEANE